MAMRIPLPPLSPAKDHSDYPLFTGNISRWLWRIYSQRLTGAGRWFALATALFVEWPTGKREQAPSGRLGMQRDTDGGGRQHQTHQQSVDRHDTEIVRPA